MVIWYYLPLRMFLPIKFASRFALATRGRWGFLIIALIMRPLRPGPVVIPIPVIPPVIRGRRRLRILRNSRGRGIACLGIIRLFIAYVVFRVAFDVSISIADGIREIGIRVAASC